MYLIVTIILIICAFGYKKIAKRYNIVDNANFRSSHIEPVIRGGGVIFYIAVLVFAIFSNFEYLYFFIAITLGAIISFIDDMITLSAKIRLPFHFISNAFILYEVGFFESPIYLILILLVAGVGFINVFNFMDGINGITGIYSIVVIGSFLVLNYFENTFDNPLLVYILISLFVFGYFNFRKKAKMFAGDIGSIVIALALLFVSLYFIVETGSPIIALFTVVYGVDGFLTIVYRIKIRESISKPHRYHIYQKLVDIYKWNHIKVSLIYGIYQLIINIIILLTYKLSLVSQSIIIGFIIIILSLHYYLLFRNIENFKNNISSAK